MHTIEFTDAAPATPEQRAAAGFARAASSAKAASSWADGLAAPGNRVQQLRVAAGHVDVAIERATQCARAVEEVDGGDMQVACARALGMLHAAKDSIANGMFVPEPGAPSPSTRTIRGIEVDGYSIECAVAYLRSAAGDLDALAHLAAFEAASLDDLLGGLLSIPV